MRSRHNDILLILILLGTALAAACSEEPRMAAAGATAGEAPVREHSEGNGLLPHQQLARELLKQLVEIDTTHSSGDTTRAAEVMAARLRAEGFPAGDVQVLGPRPNKGNLVVRFRGRSVEREPLLLLAHLDVVEADPDDWTMDPFTFNEQDGYYYGRGILDDKDEAAIHVANLIRLRREGFQPDRDIIVALTADEEGGTDNGVTWLLENHRELIDAEYALNEGGGGAMKDGKRISNAVQASEKVYQSFTLEVTNPGGHSSLPVKENAIYRLADALRRVRDYDFPVVLNDVTRVYFRRSASIEEGALADAMRGVLADPPDEAAVTFLSDTAFYTSRLRTTCVATMLDGGHAENALPQRARATVNCRVLPGEPIENVQAALEMAVGDPQVVLAPVAEATPSPPSPLTPEVLGPIQRISEELWPGVPVLPTMSTGATDGLFLRNAGIPVYGVSGIFSDIDDNRAHGQNERILARSFFEGQEFLYRLTRALSRADTQ